MAFTQPKASSTARGYGGAHAKLRRQWAPKVAAGLVSCWRCGQPILPGQDWDLGHSDTDRSVYQGPEHRWPTDTCIGNRVAGARKGRRLQSGGRKRTTRPATAAWWREARPCPICGVTFTSPYPDTRTCGRACGAEWQRRNRPAKPAKVKPAKAEHPCPICSTSTTRRVYCSDPCVVEANARKSRNRYRVRIGLPTDERPRISHAERIQMALGALQNPA